MESGGAVTKLNSPITAGDQVTMGFSTCPTPFPPNFGFAKSTSCPPSVLRQCPPELDS